MNQSITFSENSLIHTINCKAFYFNEITSITIPSSVEKICEEAFGICQELKEVNFSPNSKLKTIESYAFRNTKIEYIKIPSHVTELGDYAFYYCKYLNEVDFSEGSEIHSFGKYIFADSSIEKVSIPSNILEFKDGWNLKVENLKYVKFIPGKEKNAIYYNNEFIISKSDQKSDNYDILLFANQDIEKAKIPSFVKIIANNAFCNSKRLKSIEFSEDSEIQAFNDYAFIESNIQEISVPSSLMHYTSMWACRTSNINKINIIPSKIKNISCINDNLIVGKTNFESDQFDILLFAPRKSKRNEIFNNSLSDSDDCGKIMIPSYIKKINQYSFNKCESIEKVSF